MEEPKTIETTDTKHKPKTRAQMLAEKMEKQRVGQSAFEAGIKPIVSADSPVSTAAVTEEKPVETPEKPEIPAQAPTKEENVITAPPEKEKVAEGDEGAPEEEVNGVFLNLDDIEAPKKQKKKSYSLYLSEDVMKEAKKRAQKAGIKNPAPYIDEVLRKVFGL